jgi:predicted ATPase
MKILDFKIEGFRSLKSVHWKPGDINLLIGPNAGGKSNLLQALEMITESAQGKLAEFIKNQGGMGSVVWDGKASHIKVFLELSSNQNKEKQDTIVSYSHDISRLGPTSTFQVENEICKLHQPSRKLFQRTSTDASYINTEDKETELKNIPEAKTFLSMASRNFPAHSEISNFQKTVSSWMVYSEFNTGKDASIRQAFVTSHENKVEPNGQNFVSVLHTLYEEEREFKQEINSGMKAAFGEDYEELSFPPAADQRTQLRLRWKSLKSGQSAANLSDGTLRFLYLLTILADPDPPALIAIDEPEVGLHPRMLPIIAEYALEASRQTQVILATHSPEMLSAFGKRQSEVTVTVAEWEEGQTKLKTLSGEKLDYWLKEYTLGELFRSGELEDM